MLESEIKKLTSAVTELTAAINSGGYAAPALATTPVPSQDAQKTPSPAPAAVAEPVPLTTEQANAALAAETPAEVPAEAKVPTKKVLVEKFIELAQTKDREVAVKLLADFGVSKLPELTDKSKWADFVAAVDALLAG